MSKSRQKIDTRQQTFDFSWETRVDRYVEAKEALEEAIASPQPSQPVENEFEACIEVAAAVKQAIRDWGRTREELVEKINQYFGRSAEGAEGETPACRKPLSIHMLNNYLSKPTEYPLPAYYLFAIHHITGSLAPAETIVAAEGVRVATGQELR